MPQTCFERVEKKYILTYAQYDALCMRINSHIRPDAYGAYAISNIYYDTDQFDLIRASIEKPVYKEKLRMRCYGPPEKSVKAFLELKKKYQGVVYKRRILFRKDAGGKLCYDASAAENSRQVHSEILHFLELYPLKPKAFISYNRLAFCGEAEKGLRITFDDGILFRATELSFEKGRWGASPLPPGKLLMEVKASYAMPLWLSHALSSLAIFPSSFSKYGACYKQFILPALYKTQGGLLSA